MLRCFAYAESVAEQQACQPHFLSNGPVHSRKQREECICERRRWWQHMRWGIKQRSPFGLAELSVHASVAPVHVHRSGARMLLHLPLAHGPERSFEASSLFLLGAALLQQGGGTLVRLLRHSQEVCTDRHEVGMMCMECRQRTTAWAYKARRTNPSLQQ